MNKVHFFTKKQFYISICISLLMIGSYAAFKYYLLLQNTFVRESLSKSYKFFQSNVEASWKALDTYAESYVSKTSIPSSHQITEALHPSIVKAFFIADDSKQTPIELKNAPNWGDIEIILNLSKGTASKSNSRCFKEKDQFIFMWLCSPVYHNEKIAGYMLGKQKFGSEFAKDKYLSFFLVQESQATISLSSSENINLIRLIPPISDSNTFDKSNFMSSISINESLCATEFNSPLSIGFAAIYSYGNIYNFFKAFIALLFAILFLILMRSTLIVTRCYWKKIIPLFIHYRIAIVPFLCLFIGGLLLQYSIKIHLIIKQTRVNLQTEHAKNNVALAQKINTACLLAPNKNPDNETLLKTLKENTPTRIESLSITDSTNKIISQYSQTQKVNQEIMCKIIGISKSSYRIEIPNWTLHSIYAISYEELPLQKIRGSLILFILFFFLFAILCWYTYQIFLEKTFNRWVIITMLGLAFSNAFLWGIVNYIPVTHFNSTNTIKTPADNSLLTAKADIIAGNRQMLPPTRTKIGLEIQKLDLAGVNKTTIQGKIWQSAADNDDIGFIIANEQDTKIDAIHNSESTQEKNVLWRIFTKITTPDEYKGYPFSVKHIKLSLSSNNVQKPILLLPDEALLQLGKTIWLAKGATMHGFSLIDHSITSDFPSNEATKNVIQGFSNSLSFNLSFRESLVGALFTYIFPLLIIFLAIFGILWVKDSVRFTAYSGVFFADILLHRTLRGSLNLVEVVYLDCFFFYTYLALIMLMCGTLIVLSRPTLKDYVDNICRQIYWPLQLLLWMMTTAWFFC